MTFAAATGAPLIVTATDGGRVEIPKPKRRALGELYARWVAEDRARLVALLDAANATAELREQRLSEFADKARQVTYPLTCLHDYGRADETLMLTIAEEQVDRLDRDAALIAAGRCWGYRLDVPEDGQRPLAVSPLP